MIMKEAGVKDSVRQRRGLHSLWGKERHTVRREAGVARAGFRLASKFRRTRSPRTQRT